MTELELEQAILDYIRTVYKADYIGCLNVIKSDTGYMFKIGIPSYMYPTTMAGDFTSDEEFLDYIYNEFRTRNYMRVYFYKVHRTTTTTDGST